MDEKNKKGSFWSNLPEIIKAFAAIITALGSLGGLLLALNQLGVIGSVEAEPTASVVPKFGWEIYFEHELGEGYWKSGNNSYQFIVDCPDTDAFGDIDNLVEFSVNQSANLYPNDILELRFFGIPSPNEGEGRLETINPDQNTKFIIYWLFQISEQN